MTNTIKKKYKEETINIISRLLPNMLIEEIEEAIESAIASSYVEHPAHIYNNYEKKTTNTTVLELTNFILDREPIMTSYGVLFKKHADVKNPIIDLVVNWINERGYNKKEMFKYPKGSEDYEKYNLLQLLSKIDANGFYGVLGQFSSLFFNLHVASSITTQGRSAISAAALLFESFFNNNVPFASLDEVLVFVNNVSKETDSKQSYIKDNTILDKDIDMEVVLYKLMTGTGFGYIPSKEDIDIVATLLNTMSQTQLNRIFYKNNLFAFLNNSVIKECIKLLLVNLEEPYLDPNKVPKEIASELEEFWSLLSDYVYYDKQIIDRINKLDSLIRSNVLIVDTDSNILSLDGWYRFARDLVKDTPMKIKQQMINPVEFISRDEFGDLPLRKVAEVVEDKLDFNFYDDDIVKLERTITPDKIIAEDGLTFSIINIMAYCATQMIDDYMIKYTKMNQSYADGKPCLMIMKNEFYFKSLILTPAKKNYATVQLLQEGNLIPKNKQLDIKGLPVFAKSTMNITTRERLKKILLEDIMSPENIDPVKVLKDIAIEEKLMFNSMKNGEKKYYKPARIKSISNYVNPMSIQGIKASIVYNAIKDDDMDTIDLEARNSIIIIKCDITNKNINKIENEYPSTYTKIINLLENENFKGIINSVALPSNEEVPQWILPFVDYNTIISDNISLFPLGSIGIHRINDKDTKSNIISF